MKKRALIIAYAKKNLGDDLFIQILANRYKHTMFYLGTRTKYEKKSFKAANLKLINPAVVKTLNNLSFKSKIHKLNTNNILSRFCHVTVLIGGSMFIQNSDLDTYKHQISERFSHLRNKYYIIGSNFGPYKDKEYHQLHSEVFENAEDVSFREEHSYKLFEGLKNIRYASDIVFSMDTNDIKVANKKQVVISVIDLSCRNELSEFKEMYENKIKEMCEHFISSGYEVTLMSFCNFEGDKKAIESILGLLDKKTSSKVEVYLYDGDIQGALNVIAGCEVVIATRFHAMILGLLFNKKVLPIIYSNKTLNVLNDIEFKGEYVRIEEMDKFDIAKVDLEYKLDISKQIEDSHRHFENLDKYLEI